MIEGKISWKLTRARGSIISQKAKQLVLHLWMYWQSVRKRNNESDESRRKQCYVRAPSKNEPGLFFILGFFIVRNETTLRHFLLGLFLFWESTFFCLSFCILFTTAKTCASFNLRCGTCSLVCFSLGEARHLPFVLPTIEPCAPRTWYTVNTRVSVISLTPGFSSWRIPLWRRDMFINLWKAKTRTCFSRESLLFKWINRVCRFDGFPWNLVKTSTNRYETKPCRRFPLF